MCDYKAVSMSNWYCRGPHGGTTWSAVITMITFIMLPSGGETLVFQHYHTLLQHSSTDASAHINTFAYLLCIVEFGGFGSLGGLLYLSSGKEQHLMCSRKLRMRGRTLAFWLLWRFAFWLECLLVGTHCLCVCVRVCVAAFLGIVSCRFVLYSAPAFCGSVFRWWPNVCMLVEFPPVASLLVLWLWLPS